MKPSVLFALLFWAVAQSGCSLLGYEVAEVRIMPVDTLVAPAETAAGEAFTIRVVGLLTNGCQRFERLDVDRTPRTLEVRMLARERVPYGAVCTAEVRRVERDYVVAPPFETSLEIVVHGHDGRASRRAVLVR